jgi:hypothetical protein
MHIDCDIYSFTETMFESGYEQEVAIKLLKINID